MNRDFDQILLDEIPDAIIISMPNGMIARWNSGAESVFGYTNAEAIGHSLNDLVIPVNQPELVAESERESEKSGVSIFESTRRRKDESLIHAIISTKSVRNVTGDLEYVISTVKDISHLKVLRDAKLAEAKYGELLESAPDAIIMASPGGMIVLANSHAERLFGYERGELIGQPVELLLPVGYHGGYIGQHPNIFSQPKARAMGAGLELSGLRKDGTEFPAEISLSPLNSDQGALVMSAIRDITERKRNEQSLLEKNIELQNAAEAKNRFLANMSHELRTPLNGIIGFAEFMVDGKPGSLNAKQEEYLGDILNSGRHLLQLINDVLDLAKVDAGKMEFIAETFSIPRAISEVCAVAKPIGQNRGLQVSVDVGAGLDLVTLDQKKFKQVLYNLLANAIKFTDGGGRISITAGVRGPDQFEVSVHDTGIGIKPEDLPRLFREFEQLESGTDRHYEGTGLGLVLTRKIVDLQGGSISVESAVGIGSTFTVVLPLIAETVNL